MVHRLCRHDKQHEIALLPDVLISQSTSVSRLAFEMRDQITRHPDAARRLARSSGSLGHFDSTFGSLRAPVRASQLCRLEHMSLHRGLDIRFRG
jgi:hypothetical protein